MSGFKAGDKVWWVREVLEGVTIHPVVVTDPNAGWRARVQLRGGYGVYVLRHELHRSHAEAIQYVMGLDGFEFHEAHREQGWK